MPQTKRLKNKKKFPTDGHHTSPGKMMDGEDTGKPFVPLHVNNSMQNLFWKPRISHFYFYAQLNPLCFQGLSIFCCGLTAAYLSLLMEVTSEWGEYEMHHLGGRIRGTAQPKVTALLLSGIFSLAGQQQHRHHRNFTRSFPGNVLSALLIRIHKHTHTFSSALVRWQLHSETWQELVTLDGTSDSMCNISPLSALK